MESETPSLGECGPQESTNYDELFLHKTLIFSESLKDLRNLRKQLHSAAEYFEQSYRKDEQKQIAMETLKDYVIKVLINTVDHLGFVAYKVNTVLDEKAGEISGAERQLSCIEQRLGSCQKFIDRQELAEQSLVINTTKHHKRQVCRALPSPVPHVTASNASFPLRVKLRNGKSLHNVVHRKSNQQSCIPYNDEDASLTKIAKAVRAKSEIPSPLFRNEHSAVPSRLHFSRPGETFSFTNISAEKRADSPLRSPFIRSGSLVTRPVTPNSADVKRYPSEPRRSVSFSIAAQRDRAKDIETQPSKSKRLMKAFLSMHKSKKSDSFYRYLDEN
ncbi:hypothetical protein RJ641_001418 [Dillenia turbinata]|uniref:Protein ABIL2-like n=1 Tax=Dillenia turbinata TaxID=194707 RepID=A0AAN8W8G9_9MAGN